MATSTYNLPFLLPATRLQMKDVATRGVTLGLVLCVVAITVLVMSFTSSHVLFVGLESLLVGAGALLWGLRLIVSGARLPFIPHDESLENVLRPYRALGPLRAKSSSVASDLIRRLPDEELRVAAVLPDYSEQAHAAARAELHARGADERAEVPVIPSFLPPHERMQTRKLLLTAGGGIRTACYSILRPLRPAFWLALPIAFLLIFLRPDSSGLAQDVGLENVRATAEFIVGPIAGLLILGVGLVEAVLFILANGRRYPARILFLRKFNSPGLQRSYRNLTCQLRPCGHIFGLSDRFLRDSWLRWFFRMENLGVILFKLVFALPAVLLLRLVDSVRFGPSTIRRAGDYRRFCRHLTERRWLNFRSCYLEGGIYVRTSDEWWQIVALTLLVSSDVIVLDLSEPTDAIRWEMRTISQFDLWHRVVVVCREDERAELEALTEEFDLPQVWLYASNGQLYNYHDFIEAVLTAVHSSVAKRWAAATAVQSDPPATNGAAAMRPAAVSAPGLEAPRIKRFSPGPATFIGAVGLIVLGLFVYEIITSGGEDVTGNDLASPGSVPEVEQRAAEVRHQPSDAEEWFNLGIMRRDAERFTEAAEAFRIAAELDPQNADYAAYLAEVLVLQSGSDIPSEAESLFRRALELDPSHPQARYYLALLRDMRGDPAGAIDDLLELLREAPPEAVWEQQVHEAALTIARLNGIDISDRLPPRG